MGGLHAIPACDGASIFAHPAEPVQAPGRWSDRAKTPIFGSAPRPAGSSTSHRRHRPGREGRQPGSGGGTPTL